MRVVLGVVRALLWLLLGAAVGLAAAVTGSSWWGSVLGVAATVALAVAAAPGWTDRVPMAVGWSAVVLRLALPRPEGDYVVADTVGGYLLLALGLALVVAALVTVPVRRRVGPAGSGSAPPAS